MIQIPTEIKDKSAFPQLKKIDRLTIAYAVLFGVDNQTAFALYHPEYLTANGKLNDAGKTASKHFWGYGKIKDYREVYEQELAEFLGRKQTSQSSEFDELSEEDKAEAVKMFRGKVYRAMRTVDETNIAALTDVGGLAKSTKVLNENEEQEIRPIRVLPTRCKSECRYRKFVETAKAEGQIADDCDYCKARAFAEEHGFKYDPCAVLNLPEDVVTRIDEYNDIKLTDILSGKVDN